MTMQHLRTALSGILLGCSACVAVPPPVPIAPAVAATPPPSQNCREFQQTISVGGQVQQAYGMACQQADGTWQLVSPASVNPPPASVSVVPYAAYPVYPYYPWYNAYPGAYPGAYPWYFGPNIEIGLGFGFGRGGGHGRWRR